MRKIIALLVVAAVLATAYWVYQEQGGGNPLAFLKQYVENGEVATFKARYTPEQLMETHYKELLANENHSFESSETKFYPYLLMEVKYTQPDKRSREGVLLWSLVDGEMVLNTSTWEKTHGYRDAIEAGANRNDFRLMQALAKSKGTANSEQLEKELHVDKEMLQSWIESAVAKHLIVKRGSEYQLHFQDPKLIISPETKMSEGLVKKPYSFSQRLSKRYSQNQIEKISKAAFGDDFTIRTATEVFLPTYKINVVNPDGSISSTWWNAITGQLIPTRIGE